MPYTTNVDTNYCSCKHWKYQRKPVSARDCKHLIANRGFALQSVDEYEYVQNKPAFMLLSENIPKRPIMQVENYLFSRKFDGIRCALDTDGRFISRGGVLLFDIPFTPPFQLDGELCHRNTEGHVHVMKALDKKQYHLLVFRAFDLWPPVITTTNNNKKTSRRRERTRRKRGTHMVLAVDASYATRYKMLQEIVTNNSKNEFITLVTQHDFSNTGTSLQEQVNTILEKYQANGFEGVVVRCKTSPYTNSGRRDNTVMFKAKKVDR